MTPEDIARKPIDALAMPLGKRGPRARARRRPLSFRRPPAERLKNKTLALEWLWVPISELKNRPLSSTRRKIADFIEKNRGGARILK